MGDVRSGDTRAYLPSFKILYSCDPFLRIRDHFTEQICEAGTTELGGTGAIEVPIVDGLAVGGGAETGMLLWRLLRDALGGLLYLKSCGGAQGFGGLRRECSRAHV